MTSKSTGLFLLLSLVTATLAVQAASVPRFAPHEVAFTSTGTYSNPYVELTADATLTEPDGRTIRTIPLFWDGAANWKMRFAPDKTLRWDIGAGREVVMVRAKD